MTGQDLPPLDDDVRSLLASARGTTPAPPDVQLRVLSRVEALVLPPPPGGGGGTTPGAGSVAPASVGTLRRVLALAATFTLGGLVGAGVMWVAAPSPAPIVVPSPPVVVYVESPAAPVASASPAPVPAVASAPAPSATSTQDGLRAERALLDVARGALERQDGAAALAATREHERRFPSGLLVQEREAMAVRALLLLGRRDEARARTDRFRARYAGSVLLPTLESAISAPSSSSP
jgi:hypothetical protein